MNFSLMLKIKYAYSFNFYNGAVHFSSINGKHFQIQVPQQLQQIYWQFYMIGPRLRNYTSFKNSSSSQRQNIFLCLVSTNGKYKFLNKYLPNPSSTTTALDYLSNQKLFPHRTPVYHQRQKYADTRYFYDKCLLCLINGKYKFSNNKVSSRSKFHNNCTRSIDSPKMSGQKQKLTISPIPACLSDHT